MKEEWRDILRYKGFYQVSNQGRVRSLDRVVPHKNHGTMRLKGRILSPGPSGKHGHLRVALCKEGAQSTRDIHQLVAAAWIGPCPKAHEVRHGKNGVTDNSVGNLSYGTRSDNHLDKRRDGTHGGRAVRRSDGVEFLNMHIAAEETPGCEASNIWKVCNVLLNTTGGYSWEYT